MTFANGIQIIAYGYNPASQVTGQPQTSSGTASSATISNIAMAFNIAPPTFQMMLCKLDGLYLDPNLNGSWGYRDQNTRNNRYVAFDSTLFDSSGWAESLDAYQNARLQFILQSPDSAFSFGPATSSTSIPSAQVQSSITVLAALAHEVGHIFWNDGNKASNGTYDYHFCNNNFLIYWKTITPPDPWNYLGFLDDTKSEHKSDDSVLVKDIEKAQGNDNKLLNVLDKLYDKNNTRWISALAAFTPDEDFVETFENVVLTSSKGTYPLTSQTLYYAGSTIGDAFQYKTNVISKKNCFVGY